jgi:hypothetical protein
MSHRVSTKLAARMAHDSGLSDIEALAVQREVRGGR